MSKLSSAAICGLVFTLLAATASARTHRRAPAPAWTRRRRCSRCAWPPMRAVRTTRCTAATAPVITHARLGLVLDGFGNQPATRVSNARRAAADQRWEQPWGEQRVIRDRHAELR